MSRTKLNGKLVPPPPSAKLHKPNDALVMVPKVGRLNSVLRKMFNLMLHCTQNQILDLRKDGKQVLGTTMFSAKLGELVKQTTDGDSDARASAKKYLLEMRRTEVDWEAPDADSNLIWANMGLLSQVQLESRNNEVWVIWALPPALLSAVSDPIRYTPIDTEVLAKLHSYAAIALYEICVRYRNNPTNLTSRNPTSWWIDALRSIPAEIDPITKVVKRPEWRKFKNEQVVKAIIEINTNTDLLVELQEYRSARSVDSAQFSVHKKPANTDIRQVELMINVVLSEQASRLGLDYKHLQKSIAKGHSEERIAFALSQLESRLKRNDLVTISSIPAYFAKILSEPISLAAQVDLLPTLQSNNEGDTSISQTIGISAPASLQVPQLEPLVQQPEWLSERTAIIRSKLLELNEEEQSRYLLLVEVSLKNKGVYSVTTAQSITKRKWQQGLLLSEMINFYGQEHYGPDWKSQP